MGKETWLIFATMLTFASICIPIVTYAQWPITADPSLTQNDLNNPSEGKSNETLPTK
ncbi:MAG TPA: hypothetical protein VH797_06240 [Nitrososphaeraceae archaeon]|jgi:hypothetical protein